MDRGEVKQVLGSVIEDEKDDSHGDEMNRKCGQQPHALDIEEERRNSEKEAGEVEIDGKAYLTEQENIVDITSTNGSEQKVFVKAGLSYLVEKPPETLVKIASFLPCPTTER
jgi:hypothetical protein